MIISSQQLVYQYSWTAIPPDDPRVTGKADSVFVGRYEGYEMLDFLNRHCKTLANALKAERLIRAHMPGTVRARENIVAWLNRNWTMYP